MLECWDDEENEPHHVNWDSVMASGMLMLQGDDDENTTRKALQESLKAKCPMLGVKEFDFVKVRHKTVKMLQLGPWTEYNYAVIKKIAGQGLLSV